MKQLDQMKSKALAAAMFGVSILVSAMAPSPVAFAKDYGTAPVTLESTGSRATMSGTLVPYKEVTLAAQVPGQVKFFAGHEGDAIKSGELLVAISDDAMQAQRRAAMAQLFAAEAGLRNAHVQYSRELWSPNSGKPSGMGLPSMMDQFMRPFSGQYAGPNNPWVRRYADLYGRAKGLDSARSQLLQTKALIEQLDSKIRDAKLKAPFDGVITAKYAEIGDTVQPGQKLIRVAHVAYLRIKAEVPVSMVYALQPGQLIPAKIDVGSGIFVDARVAQIFPVADKARHTVTVKFDLPRRDLLLSEDKARAAPGAYAEVYIPNPSASAKQVPTIPKEALIRRGSLPAVEVLINGKSSFRLVRVGKTTASGRLSVLSGLKGGETVKLQSAIRTGALQAGATAAQ